MPPSSSLDARDAAIKQAKRYLRDAVRNDWSFENDTFQSHPHSALGPQDVREWRQRECDSSSSELEAHGASVTVEGISVQNHASGRDSAIAESEMGLSPAEKKEKRRREREEEITWNKGLKIWTARRDAWTGALRRRDIYKDGDKDEDEESSQLERSKEYQENGSEQQQQDVACISAPSTPTSPSSSNPHYDNLTTRTETQLSISEKGHEPEKRSTDTGITEPEPSSSTASASKTQDSNSHPTSPENGLLIPIAPPILPTDHPIRASINPSLYPSIYSKVVVQGLTPTVPINLSDMTHALVQGWKADGQWPPRSTPMPAPTLGIRRDRNRGLNITTTVTATTTSPKSSTPFNTGAGAGNDVPSSPESRKRSTVASAVKKVLHFSGLHRRNPSHGNANVDHRTERQASIPVVEEGGHL
ncbi:hypothetical protein MPDQ_002707 [Monascus purpureus]|uniref:Gag1-like clamp domain-containing protein n=1 Tax=Monascus purpureus TaxID=5098 RepID=A0A507QK12_MONPU|nr:hypothetical protein MPDQ_002707 [Monascus purpureus]BDD60805.1 hypothetical protein MAP00_005905 [Monascus purpureus]